MHLNQPPSAITTPAITTPANSTVPTLAAAIAAVDGWTDLSPKRRALLKSRLQRVADMLGDPAQLIVLSPGFVRARLLAASPSAFGLSEGTFRAYRSAVREAMDRLGMIDVCDAPMSPAWRALLATLDKRARAALTRLAHFCALRGIEPDQLTNAVFAEFCVWLEARTLIAKPKRHAGSCRRAWNNFAVTVPGWPAIQLEAPGANHQYILPLDAFTPAFQADLARFGARLGARSRPFSGRHRSQQKQVAGEPASEEPDTRSGILERGAGLRPISVQARLGHVRWAASALVASGSVPISGINAVTDLVQPPDRAHDAMEFLFELRGQKPWPGALHALEALLMLAKYEAKLPEAEIEALRGWRRDVAPASKGMSPRRRDRIRAVMEPHRLQMLLQLPSACMQQALDLLPEAPRDATSLAMRALAVQLLLTTQLRLWNIITMKVGDHLQSHDPAHRRFQRLDIAAGNTKNRNPIMRPLSPATQAILELWVRHFRPLLAQDTDGYLFPGHGTPHIGRQGMRDAVKGITKHVTGQELTPHDFRGLAAKLHLHFNPGDFASVMHLLSHTGIKTALDSYTVDAAERAAEDFDRTILRLTKRELSLSKPPTRPKGSKPRSPLLAPNNRPRSPRGRS